MKKLILIAIFGISTLAFAQETKNTTTGVFDFESEVIDYGKIKQNADGNRVFTFKNIGNTPIIISNIKGSCGCTVATKPNAPIMPGKTGEIGIKYATNRIGGFSKTITITSNASESRKVLRVKGIVLKSEQASKSAISVTK
ncbi:MAG: DUF1573 domain-containing protein [Flavobacteriaceae bacterium]|nr:DUF1573 domain-containing protein [Flavobacteriaceae bacterium]